MALEGQLHDFSATEILQLVASQRKTGRLTVDHAARQLAVFVVDGRIVSTRAGGPLSEDPLGRFLRRIHRLTDDQWQGIVALHGASHRDLEDLLVEGRYLTPDELAVLLERQLLDDLTDLIEWTDGSYRFDADARPVAPVRLKLSTEASLIEAARRSDERQRYRVLFGDGRLIVSVRDLPDPEEQISDEESELFGIIDGQRTVQEVVTAAPLSDYEASEALQRMIEAGWVEFLGRRDGAPNAATAPTAAPAVASSTPPRPTGRGPAGWATIATLARELVVAALCCACLEGFVLLAHVARTPDRARSERTVFDAARLRDVRQALELYRRESGHYPTSLGDLIAERWIEPDEIVIEGRPILYRPRSDRDDYTLELSSP